MVSILPPSSSGDGVHHPLSEAQIARERLGRLVPLLFQLPVTQMTGKAAVHEPVPAMAGPLSSWVACLVQLGLSVSVMVALLIQVGPSCLLLVPLSWLLSVNALRRLLVQFAHYAVHDQMSDRRWVNRTVHAISSCVAVVHCFEDYWDEHVRDHHSRRVFTTRRDPDAAFLYSLGFIPGLPVAAGWRLLARTTVSPRFHLVFLRARLRTNLLRATWPRRVLAAVWLGVLVVLALAMPWWVFVTVVLLPLVPLYHVSSLLQFLSEHPWMSTSGPPRSREDYANGCWARIALTPLPPEGLTGRAFAEAWGRWAAHMLLVQAPWRFGVLVGDLAVHDFHHLYPQERRWWLAPWLRQAAIDAGDPRRLAERELMGPRAAIDTVLRGLAESPLATRTTDTTDIY